MIQLRQGTTSVVPSRFLAGRALAPEGRFGSATGEIGSLVENFILGFAKSIRLFIFPLPVLFLIPSARAQQSPNLSALVADVSKELEKTHVKNVIFFDFIGPADYISEYGRSLADLFSAELAKSSGGLSTIDRSSLKALIDFNRLAPETVTDRDIATWLAKSLGARAAIAGKLSMDGGNLEISLDCFQIDSEQMLWSHTASFLIQDEIKNILTKSVDPDFGVVSSRKGSSGPSFPTCQYCPPATFSKEASRKNTEGTVVLSVVVGTDGRARDIRVLRPLADGLTLNAIRAVQMWRFNPVTDQEGTLLDQRTTIEISFRHR